MYCISVSIPHIRDGDRVCVICCFNKCTALSSKLGFHSAFFFFFLPVRIVQGRRTEGLLGSVGQEIDSNGKNPGFYPTKQVVLQTGISQGELLGKLALTGPFRKDFIQCLVLWFSRKHSLRQRVNSAATFPGQSE